MGNRRSISRLRNQNTTVAGGGYGTSVSLERPRFLPPENGRGMGINKGFELVWLKEKQSYGYGTGTYMGI